MKALSLFISLVSVLSAAGPKLSIQEPFERDIFGVAPSVGVFRVTLCTDTKGQNYGPILIWENRITGSAIEVADVCALEEVCRQEIENSKLTKDEAAQKIVGILNIYFGSRNDRLILAEPLKTRFERQLRSHISPAEYERMHTLFVEIPSQLTEKAWRFSFLVLTSRNGLERYSVSGTLNPFSIVELNTTLLVPSGTIPKFEFVP